MTTLENFVKFAETLSGQDYQDIERLLETVMESYQHESLLTAEQEIENRRRFESGDGKYAKTASIESIFGKPL